MTLKAVLFDLDGTLLDTAPDFITVLNRLREEENRSPLPAGSIRRTVSNGARALIYLGFGLNPGEPGFDRLHQRLLTLYAGHLAVDTRPFDGIPELLRQLAQRHLPWGIVTNKASEYTLPLVRALDFAPAPGAIVCPDHVSRTKPDPEPLLLACRQLDCPPQQALYVGDHRRDIDCGKAAGSLTAAAAFGYVPEGDNPADWQADYLISHASELAPIIAELSSHQP